MHRYLVIILLLQLSAARQSSQDFVGPRTVAQQKSETAVQKILHDLVQRSYHKIDSWRADPPKALPVETQELIRRIVQRDNEKPEEYRRLKAEWQVAREEYRRAGYNVDDYDKILSGLQPTYPNGKPVHIKGK